MKKIFITVSSFFAMIAYSPNSHDIENGRNKVMKHTTKQANKRVDFKTNGEIFAKQITDYVSELLCSDDSDKVTIRIWEHPREPILLDDEKQIDVYTLIEMINDLDLNHTVSKNGLTFDLLRKFHKTVCATFLDCFKTAMESDTCLNLNKLSECSYVKILKLEKMMQRFDPDYRLTVSITYRNSIGIDGRFSAPIEDIRRHDYILGNMITLRTATIVLPEALGGETQMVYR